MSFKEIDGIELVDTEAVGPNHPVIQRAEFNRAKKKLIGRGVSPDDLDWKGVKAVFRAAGCLFETHY